MSVLAKPEGSSLAGEILGALADARWKRMRRETDGLPPMSPIEIYREDLALIDQKLSGVTGDAALISTHIFDVLGGDLSQKRDSLELIQKAADRQWEVLKVDFAAASPTKIDNVPETKE